MSSLSIPDHSRKLGWLLLVYWLMLFTGTHLPPGPKDLTPNNFDKVLHLTAYTGLTFLLVLWVSSTRPLRWRHGFILSGVILGFAAFDELSQTPVGRDADFKDWLADALGCLLGWVGFLLVSRLRPEWWQREP